MIPIESRPADKDSRLRQWFGKVPAEPDVLIAAESAESQARILYCLDGGTERGDSVDVVAGLRSKLLGLQRNASNLKSHSPERSLQLLLMVLVDCVPSDIDRLSVLKDLGTFRVDPDLSSDERRARMLEILRVPEGGVGHEAYEKLARSLGEIWTPEQDEFLDAVINRPSALGKLLSQRLDPAGDTPLTIVGHPFDRLDDRTFEALLASNTAAYEKDGAIHMLAGLPPVLDSWDRDPLIGGGPEGFSLLETFILHELIEIVLSETTQIEPLPCHIVATTFERCLRDRILGIAVEAFYLDWSSARSEGRDGEEDVEEEEATSRADQDQFWWEVSVSHDEVSAEALEERTDEERERLLSEMFDEDDSAETSAATEDPEPAEPAVAPKKSTLADLFDDEDGPVPETASQPPPKKSTLADLFDDEDDPVPETASQPPRAEHERLESKQRIASNGKQASTADPLEAGNGPVVLIVDDSSVTRRTIRSVVEKLGFTPVEAEDGIQAIVQARSREPDVIVLDIVMPGKSGFEVLEDLRQDEKFAATPIIMLSAQSDRASIQRAMIAKATDYLVKPVNPRVLEKRIKQCVKEQP